jgi:hypothetical protein
VSGILSRKSLLVGEILGHLRWFKVKEYIAKSYRSGRVAGAVLVDGEQSKDLLWNIFTKSWWGS